MFGLIIIPLFIVGNMAQVPIARPCNLTPMENVTVAKLAGTWYEYARYPMNYQSRCETEHVEVNPNGTITLTARFYLLNTTSTNRNLTIRESVHLMDSHGMLIPLEGPPITQNFTILSTDYESYLIQGLCVDAGPISLYNYWVFGRMIEPSQSVKEKINQVLRYEEIQVEYFQMMNQTGCVGF